MKIIIVWALALLVAAPVGAAERADLLIRHATIVDVAGAGLVPGQAVAVRGRTIVATGDDMAIARRFDAPRTVDAGGKYLMPGLWDMHVHFGGGTALIAENKALLDVYLAYGVTTVRDCAADLASQVIEWRDAIDAGTLAGPTIFTSGPKLEGPKPIWKGTIEVDSPAQVDAALDRLQAMRVDFVKITDNTLKPDIFLYAVGAAKTRGLKTSAHIPYALTVETAARAGLSAIEHIDYLIKAGSPQEASIAADYVAGRLTYAQTADRLTQSFDPAYAAASYRRLAALGISVTPTLNMSRIIAWLGETDHGKDDGLALMGPGLRATYDWRVERARKLTAAETAAKQASYRLSQRIMPMLVAAGVPILAGTDAGYLNSFNYPGIGLHDELARYVEAGLTPPQALASAIQTGPKFLGKGGYGAVAAGNAADLLLLTADPLVDIAATRRIAAVVSHGNLYDRARLDAMLANARKMAAKPASVE